MTKFIIFILLMAILYAVYKYQEQYQEQHQNKCSKGKQKKVKVVKFEEDHEESIGSLEELNDGDINELGSLIDTDDIGSNDSLLNE